MEWYIVIKTIKGRRYRYRQKTWREGGCVRTLSQYVSREVIVGYHGTFAKFERFDAGHLGSANDCDSSQEGFFFASNRNVAVSYASTQIARQRGLDARIRTIEARIESLSGMKCYEVRDVLTEDPGPFAPELKNKLKHFCAMQKRAMEKLGERTITKLALSKRAEVKTCVLDLRNPYIHNMNGRRFDDEEFCEAAMEARDNGHDGVIIRKTYDPGSCFDRRDDLTDVYIVFDPGQIRPLPHEGQPAQAAG
jgi:hypothetical protein